MKDIKKYYKVVTTEITKTLSTRFVEALSERDVRNGEVAIYDFPPVATVELEFQHVELVSVTKIK